jgi:hypothetical protein
MTRNSATKKIRTHANVLAAGAGRIREEGGAMSPDHGSHHCKQRLEDVTSHALSSGHFDQEIYAALWLREWSGSLAGKLKSTAMSFLRSSSTD